MRNVLTQISLVFLLFLASAAYGQTAAKPDIILEPTKPGPGDVMVVTVKNFAGQIEGTFNNRKIYFNPAKESVKAIVAIDYFTEPGTYDLNVSVNGSAYKETVEVVKKEYRIDRLTLPKRMVELSPKDEARAEREAQRMAAIWPNETEREWAGDFINPLPGDIITPFGVRRIINNIPKSPHTGVDVRGHEGDKIVAPNDGVVALIDKQFFGGNSLVLNHGQGIYTMFFHLSKILVKTGQTVKKGDVIALVGQTGRATGPHLHWGVRVQGARIDPLELTRLKLE